MQPTKAEAALREKNKREAAERRKREEANRPRAGAGSSARQAEADKYKKPAAKAKPAAAKPATASRPTSRFAGARDANLGRINNDPRFAAPTPQPLRSPAIGAPVHASPAAFGSVARLAPAVASPQPSPYVGSSAVSPARPSTPAQAVQQQAANPYEGIGDIRQQPLPQAPVQQEAPMAAGTQQYGGQTLQGVDENGVDMERRRAFLDADNSLAGLKAVKELLNRRKLSISVES